MEYHVFHSTQVEASRDLVSSLGGDPLNTGTQTLTVNGDTITVTGLHKDNVVINPSIPGYPYVTFLNGTETVGLFAPSDWAHVKAWVAPTIVPTPKRILTQFEFTQLFTAAERKAIRQQSKSNTDLEDLMAVLNAAQDVNLDLPILINGLAFLVSLGILTATRRDKILTGVAP